LGAPVEVFDVFEGQEERRKTPREEWRGVKGVL
jgi:hypothetical protein